MRGALTIASLTLVVLAALAGGSAPFGRVALALGLPGIAAAVFTDPAWRGVALYRNGDFDAAASSFARAGNGAEYNLGTAETRAGRFAAALEAYDMALMRGPDPQAQANFDLVRAFYGGTALEAGSVVLSEKREGVSEEAPIARGDARGSGTGDAVTNTGAAAVGVESLDQIADDDTRAMTRLPDRD